MRASESREIGHSAAAIARARAVRVRFTSYKYVQIARANTTSNLKSTIEVRTNEYVLKRNTALHTVCAMTYVSIVSHNHIAYELRSLGLVSRRPHPRQPYSCTVMPKLMQ